MTLDALNAMGKGIWLACLISALSGIGDDTLEADNARRSSHQTAVRLTHGGASVVLAESIGSVAGYLCTQGSKGRVEVNVNHVRSAKSGRAVRGVCCKALHTARHQVWQ
ncbi:hotdog fold thioesterase [Salmonella enterica subsp. enterica]|nr:hotdog fold thioesterase [Salmonella enterica subsp. enterica]